MDEDETALKWKTATTFPILSFCECVPQILQPRGISSQKEIAVDSVRVVSVVSLDWQF
jgi:hypothetical protein